MIYLALLGLSLAIGLPLGHAAWLLWCYWWPVIAMSQNSSLDLELIELDEALKDAKGDARKALEMARVGVEAELEVLRATESGNRAVLRESLELLQETLSRRTTPYGRDMKGAAYAEIPTSYLDIKEQIYRASLEEML